MIPRYAEFAPRADLAAHVRCIWVFEGGVETDDQRIAPDGCSELIVHVGRPYLERAADGSAFQQAPVVFAGQLTRPLHLRADGPARVIGVRFHPAGAYSYLGEPASRYTDRRTPLAVDLGLTGLNEEARLTAVQDHVADRIAANPDPRDLAVEAAVARLQSGQTVEASRDLQRRFARVVGVPPRRLAAIFRFRGVFDALSEPGVASWTDAAHAAGYFDHPQLARDFRRFVGCTPSQFLAQQAGLAASLTQG
ncbi:MAG: AraC family transcriptional regulator [Caulobacteraceae bacterium]|nr:MAG: AraC family transcriptional regulator [Caulobacteraceae bacterium]